MRDFQDLLAGAKISPAHARELAGVLEFQSARLAAVQVSEGEQDFANLPDHPTRGQSLTPRFEVVERDHHSLRAEIRFGRFYLGIAAVHGGAIPLIFDELLGTLASWERPAARTAYLNVSYRSITPIDTPLTLEAAFTAESGRKRYLRGSIRDGETLCVEAEALFIETKH
ncbi:PaaI family thioesterase [Rhodococcus sp. T7]|uniref:PaaI family thioesterase n=1 Tax=Rhodococcus sp. T7 TaxID=627444 RepID=UPI00135CB4F5|nr:PaaI family thioesterase [Rhodococcus sp. T7]KAF0957545.1 hypothetical protein MLGJGCBP_09377 [Rhodococcus sp. T7]KAF0964455.1 hypothetical protein MLGJGCBP_02396 [Rhodococcus sp. T7]